jgi:hypothetical protein
MILSFLHYEYRILIYFKINTKMKIKTPNCHMNNLKRKNKFHIPLISIQFTPLAAPTNPQIRCMS